MLQLILAIVLVLQFLLAPYVKHNKIIKKRYMNKEKIHQVYESFPNFRINEIRILHSHREYISVYQFETDYIEAFGENSSPLIHCDKAEKAMVLSTLPYVRVKITERAL